MPLDKIKRLNLNWLGRLNEFIKYFLAVVADLSKSVIHIIWQHWIKTPLSDISTLFSVASAFLGGLNLYKAKNKNLGKTFDFLYPTLQASFALLISIAGLASGAILAVALTAMLLNVVYSLGSLVYNLHKFRKYSHDDNYPDIYLAYKQAIKKYGISLGISLIVLVAFLCLSVFFPYVPAVVSIIVGIVTSGILLVAGILNFRNSLGKKSIKTVTETPNLEVSSATTVHENNITVAPKGFEYHHVNNQLVNLTGDCIKDRKTLILVAYKSILQLQKQIYNENNRNAGFFSQTSKRSAKIDFYKNCLVFLLPNPFLETTNYLKKIEGLDEDGVINCRSWYGLARISLIRANVIDIDASSEYGKEDFQRYLNTLDSSVWQSFFKKIGNTEAFIAAMETFFENQSAENNHEEIISARPASP